MSPFANPATMADARPVFRTELVMGTVLGRSLRAARVFLGGRSSLGVVTTTERLVGGLMGTVLMGVLLISVWNRHSRGAASWSDFVLYDTVGSPRMVR